jgi:hypothetical protein
MKSLKAIPYLIHIYFILWQVATSEKLTRGVSQRGHAIYIKKYLNAKEELWKLEYFTIQKKNLQKIL